MSDCTVTSCMFFSQENQAKVGKERISSACK